MTTFLDSTSASSSADPMGGSGRAPRVLYVDSNTDLTSLLDRVDEDPSPAILVLEDAARPLRGVVAARLLHRRITAASIHLVVVTADRATIAQLKLVGISSASNVGEARRLLAPEQREERDEDSQPAWDAEQDATPIAAARSQHVNIPARAPDSIVTTETHIVHRVDPALDEDQNEEVDEDSVVPSPSSIRVVRSATPDTPRGRRRGLWLLLLLLITIVLAIGLWAYYLPQATIVISYAARPFDHTYRTVATAHGPIPLRTTHLELQQTTTVPATGSEQVPDARAHGEVALANPLDGAVHVPAGTRFSTTDGIAFETVVDVAVPSAVHTFDGTTNGQQTVQVQAVLPGIASNVPIGAIARIDGRLAGVLLVTNYAPTTGGSVRTVYHITAVDIARAAGSLTASLKSRARQQLSAKFSHSPARVVTGTSFSAPRVVSVTADGRLEAQVTLTTNVTMEYLHAEDVQRFAGSNRTINLAGQNLSVVQGTERVSTAIARNNNQFVISAHVVAQVVPQIDMTNLRGLLAGRALDTARTLLDGSARFGKWQYSISLNPDWAGHLPVVTGFIHITLRQTG